MPTIPRNPDRQVSLDPLPGPRLRPSMDIENFGGGSATAALGREARGLAGDSRDIALDLQRQEDDVALNGAFSELAAAETELLHGKDGRPGALARRGEAALSVPQEVQGELGKRLQDIEGRLSVRQRMEFKRRSAGYMAGINRQLQQHQTRAVREWDDEKLQGLLVNERIAAIAAAGDVDAQGERPRIEQAIGRMAAAIMQHGERYDTNPELTKARLQQEVSALHRGVLGRLTAGGGDLVAKAYLERYRKELVDNDLIASERAIAESSIRGESQRAVDEIFSVGARVTGTSITPVLPPATLGEAMERARAHPAAQKDPLVRDQIEARTKQRWQETKESEIVDRREAVEQASALLERSRGNLDAIPADLWTSGRLKLADKTALEARARQLRAGEKPVTDRKVWHTLTIGLANPETRSEFLKENLLLYGHKLSESDFQELVKFQAGLMKDEAEALAKADGYRTKEGIVSGGLRKWKIKDDREEEEFRRVVDEQVRIFRQTEKREPKNEEVEEIIDALNVNVTIGKGWFSPKTEPAFKSKARLSNAVKEIPTEERQQILDALRKEGRIADDETVLRLYRLKREEEARGR